MMRLPRHPARLALLAALLASAIVPVSAHASSAPLSPACTMLTAEDLATAGFALIGRPRGNTLNVSAEQSGAPANLVANICFYYEGVEGGRISANVTVEEFEHMEGVRAWLESKTKPSAHGGQTLDDIICESGSDDYADGTAPANGEKRQQHYLACDTLKGNRHVIVGFEVPESGKSLPSAEQVKGLVKTVVSRLPAPAQ